MSFKSMFDRITKKVREQAKEEARQELIQEQKQEKKKQQETAEEKKKNLVELFCKGTYKFSVEELDEPITVFDGHAHRKIAHTHRIVVKYAVELEYKDNTYNLNGELMHGIFDSEDNAYENIIKTLKDDEHMENLQGRLQKSIVNKLEEHLKNRNIEEIKNFLDRNNSFDFQFSFETEKTKNM